MNNKLLIRGCWQLSSGHSAQNGDIKPILDALERGFTTFDCADIYTGVEKLLGKTTRAAPDKDICIHTKLVPDLDCLHDINRNYVEKIIDRSLQRLQANCIDLVQFHWWDWRIKNYLSTMQYLFELQAKGKIGEIGLTNTNRKYLEEFLEHFPIASLQVQVSLFDRRIDRGLGELCRKHQIKVFAYGTLLGGFVSENWLNKLEPELKYLPNRSLVKYKLLIDDACGWTEFQRRLTILHNLAIKYRCNIANIAISALLQSKQVDNVIVGLSPKNFSAQNRSLLKLPQLETQDLQAITSWPCDLSGDVYDEERDVHGTHAKVIKYNLNKVY